MNITIPELSLVVLIGASGSGKSTFARKHFKPTETISSDYCRALASDDENDLSATDDAFRILNYIAATRLRRGNFTVIDATSVQPEARKPLVALAREHDVQPVAIVINLSERICQDRHAARTDRSFGAHVIRRQRQNLKRSLRDLRREGFRHIHILSTPEEVEAVTITRTPLWNDRRKEHGPFDIIGDIHGCCDELEMLLENLGYRWREEEIADDAARGASRYGRVYAHPEGRKAVFVGDIVDRGPRILESYELVRNMVRDGGGICVPGNHDIKLVKKLRGKNVMARHGLEQTVAEIDAIPEETRAHYSEVMASFFDSLVSHYLFDDGGLVVAHAGMKESLQGRASGRVREFALYGETTGETDEFGLPVRYNWAADYRGRARVVYGHTPVPDPEWLNGTINIDTGCVFGGRLTALRYPELLTMSVPAARVYAEPSRPFLPEDGAVVEDADDMLDLEDIFGKRQITTRLHHGITIREENSRAALEVMSRFALDPRWLIYLPPTMSPTTTSTEPGLLEHPADAFAYYRRHGVTRLVCEEKHMGSRAVIVLCRDGDAAARRFGVSGALAGVCYTRTGRAFFDGAEEHELLKRLRTALDETGFWEEFSTDWVCLDCELMPWSAKAQELLQRQYASVGAAAREGFAATIASMRRAAGRGVEMDPLLERFESRAGMVGRYIDSYRRYCWPVNSADDLKLAPFHILATEGAVHTDKPHTWHMETIHRIVGERASLKATAYRLVDLGDEESEAAGIAWWEGLTETGGEGMVVKPIDFIANGTDDRVQPAVKCRGREYLRIIYGPEYTAPENLELLRKRSVGGKRALALQEFALGMEGLERFVRKESLRKVHECAFGVLALESEPVDPRL